MQELTEVANHDLQSNGNLQFLPATSIKDLSEQIVLKLFAMMKAKAKPITKRSIASFLGALAALHGEELGVIPFLIY